VEVGFGLRGLHSGITTHLDEEQLDMGYRGSTHEDDSLHSHDKYMDIGSAGLNLSRRHSAVIWCPELYSFRPGNKVPIEILAKATSGVRDTIVLHYGLLPSHGWAD